MIFFQLLDSHFFFSVFFSYLLSSPQEVIVNNLMHFSPIYFFIFIKLYTNRTTYTKLSLFIFPKIEYHICFFVTYLLYKNSSRTPANHRTPIIWNAMHMLKNNYRIFRSITDLRDYLAQQIPKICLPSLIIFLVGRVI